MDFKTQILQDLNEYLQSYPHIEMFKQPVWAVHYWILDKLFSEDEEYASTQIVKDRNNNLWGYAWHENDKILYLVHARNISQALTIRKDNVQHDFLDGIITELQTGKCKDKALQKIYKTAKKDPSFDVVLNLYLCNDREPSAEIRKCIQEYNVQQAAAGSRISANMYTLPQMKELYYGEEIADHKTMTFDLATLNKGTVLSINTESYDLDMPCNAYFIMVPVTNIYELVMRSKAIGYPIFDANIREFLGVSGAVNKNIFSTLRNADERNNFFFYNNGITMISSEIGKQTAVSLVRKIPIKNPQIINGCQTASTIAEVLSSWDPDKIKEDFKNTFVLVRLFEIDNTEDSRKLRESIVLYNNSQNAINNLAFMAKNDTYRRIQKEFENHGFLVFLKQSDKNMYLNNKYKDKGYELLQRNSELLNRFDLPKVLKPKDMGVEILKLLQIFVAFNTSAMQAGKDKKKLMEPGSKQYERVDAFLNAEGVTIQTQILLFLLYLKAKELTNAKIIKGELPMIDFFSRYFCHQDPAKIDEMLSTKEKVHYVVYVCTMLTRMYADKWLKKSNVPGFSKYPLDVDLYEECVDAVEASIESSKLLSTPPWQVTP